jgi:hypothetical protein
MTDAPARLLAWLNAGADAVGTRLFAPFAAVPNWLSATLVAAVAGVLLLVVYKYTSSQRAIKRVRDNIDANLLALKLFRDNANVAVGAQGRLLLGAARLLVLGLVPTAVMIVPVSLLLGQLSLWYQQRPLRVGDEALVTVHLNGDPAPFPDVRLEPTPAVEVNVGPVRVFSKREVCWTVTARENGYHRLVFRVGDQEVEKELAVGDGLMRVSNRRPARELSEDLLFNPAEEPFPPDCPVAWIDVSGPARPAWTVGADSWAASWFVASMIALDWLGSWVGCSGWVLYFFVVSMIAALCFRRVLNVNL